MTSASELGANIGKRAMLGLPNSPLRFEVEITDARKRYGNLDYRVRPIAGDGWTWHASHLLTILDTERTV
jgi:hypothetical protein